MKKVKNLKNCGSCLYQKHRYDETPCVNCKRNHARELVDNWETHESPHKNLGKESIKWS